MNNILINGGDGYDAAPATDYPASFFRIMSTMAVAEGESLQIIYPGSPASVLKYNPLRTTQIYVATLRYSGMDDENGAVLFDITETYSQESGAYVYCCGMVGEGVVDGETVAVEEWYTIFTEAIAAGTVDEDSDICAHLLTVEEIDMTLDWNGIARSMPVPSGDFEDIDYGVKSGEKGDSVSTWRSYSPTGIIAENGLDGMTTNIILDTGIVCASTVSKYAPHYIIVSIKGYDENEYAINLYLDIPHIPEMVLPEYGLHPGQTQYSLSDTAKTGTITNHIITIAGDHRALFAKDDEVVVVAGNRVYACLLDNVAYADPNTLLTVDNEDIPGGGGAGSVYWYIYTDGLLFGESGQEASYQIPHTAKMFIARGTIPIECISRGGVLTVDSVEYVLFDENTAVSLMPYALSHYEVDITDKVYSESGDLSNDSIESMRYIGHYGRNPVVAIEEMGETAVGMEVSTSSKIGAYVVSNESIVEAAGQSVTFDIAAEAAEQAAPSDKNVDGYSVKYKLRDRGVISGVSIYKIYLAEEHLNSLTGIDAYLTPDGYVLGLVLSTISAVANIEADSTEISYSGDLPSAGTYVIGVESEAILCNIQEASISILQRGYWSTATVFHGAGGGYLYIYDNTFGNTPIGVLKEDNPKEEFIELYEPIDETVIPPSGTMMIGRELMEYTYTPDPPYGVMKMVYASRGKYGSTIETLSPGMQVHKVSYFRLADILPAGNNPCEYTGAYMPRITLPLSANNDPSRYGAKSVYLVEIKYDARKKI